MAVGFDAAAQHIHPYYLELQQTILNLLPFGAQEDFLLVDLGGGSGRLAALALERFPRAHVIVVDQSEAFLVLAEQRLAPFNGRGHCLTARLQDAWASRLSRPPAALVSMSAIHHLAPAEKQDLYRRCQGALAPGGLLLNGDEVRPDSDADYLAECQRWVGHKKQAMATGLITGPIRDALRQWEQRNVAGFGGPRVSGDDCHETASAQLDYFKAARFAQADMPWRRGLWAVLRGIKAPTV